MYLRIQVLSVKAERVILSRGQQKLLYLSRALYPCPPKSSTLSMWGVQRCSGPLVFLVPFRKHQIRNDRKHRESILDLSIPSLHLKPLNHC